MSARVYTAHFVLGLLTLGLLAPLGVGCGGGSKDLLVVGGKAFSQESFNDDSNAAGQQKVLERLQKMPPTTSVDAVFAVTGTAEITGADLLTGTLWTYKHSLDRRPTFAGPLVVGQGDGEVFALDARTGAEKWRTTKPKGKLIGAGSDGKTTALTTKTSDGAMLFVVGPDGSIVADQSSETALAAPAVASGLVLVPWKSLYVTAFEASTGNQLATFVTDTETTQVLTIGGAVFAGQGRLVRFDADILKAKQGGSALAIPPKDLPNVSRRELYVVPEHDDKVGADAVDYTVLAGRPTTNGPAGFVGDHIYGAYYRLVMGWSSKDAKLAWVHSGKDDIVAAHAAKDGVVTVDKGGVVNFLSGSNGAVVKSINLGKPVLSASAFADTLVIGGGGAAKDLTAQLRESVTLKADQLATAQIYLLQQAATVADEEATKVLLEVADSERATSTLRDEARSAISVRNNGAPAMVALLGRHADFLKDTRTPPVGPMAKALAAMKETKAAQPLLDHLFDPALPQRDLLDTAEAVSALATADQVPQLERFISLYRGSSAGNLKLTDACGVVAGAILRLKGDKGKEWIQSTVADSLTDADVRIALEKAIDASTPKKAVEEVKKEPIKVDPGAVKPKKKKSDDGPVPPGYRNKKKVPVDPEAKPDDPPSDVVPSEKPASE